METIKCENWGFLGGRYTAGELFNPLSNPHSLKYSWGWIFQVGKSWLISILGTDDFFCSCSFLPMHWMLTSVEQDFDTSSPKWYCHCCFGTSCGQSYSSLSMEVIPLKLVPFSDNAPILQSLKSELYQMACATDFQLLLPLITSDSPYVPCLSPWYANASLSKITCRNWQRQSGIDEIE